MPNDTVIKLIQPGTFNDQLTDVLRNGARALLAQAVEAEVADFLGTHADLKTEDGHRRVVRHGHLPEREVMTGIGPVAVRQPRVRDREAAADDPERIHFTPAILPPYARRSKSLEMLIPILYLKGISTGDFEEALAALLGKDAPGLSASTIARLKEVWVDEHKRWNERDLSAKRYVYVWADGIHLQARLEDDAQCILVIIGATPEGKKELIGFTDGTRESAHDWRTLLLDLKRRGLAIAPELAVADGALGFWKALGEVWPKTREQRCWVHKTANVLNRLPKSQHTKAKRALQEIWMAETKTDADVAFDAFIESYEVKYDKAAECLEKDREALLAFYDFPAEHWKHLRTTNPILITHDPPPRSRLANRRNRECTQGGVRWHATRCSFNEACRTWSSGGSTEARKNAARRFSPGVGRRASRVRSAGVRRTANWRSVPCGSATPAARRRR